MRDTALICEFSFTNHIILFSLGPINITKLYHGEMSTIRVQVQYPVPYTLYTTLCESAACTLYLCYSKGNVTLSHLEHHRQSPLFIILHMRKHLPIYTNLIKPQPPLSQNNEILLPTTSRHASKERATTKQRPLSLGRHRPPAISNRFNSTRRRRHAWQRPLPSNRHRRPLRRRPRRHPLLHPRLHRLPLLGPRVRRDGVAEPQQRRRLRICVCHVGRAAGVPGRYVSHFGIWR